MRSYIVWTRLLTFNLPLFTLLFELLGLDLKMKNLYQFYVFVILIQIFLYTPAVLCYHLEIVCKLYTIKNMFYNWQRCHKVCCIVNWNYVRPFFYSPPPHYSPIHFINTFFFCIFSVTKVLSKGCSTYNFKETW